MVVRDAGNFVELQWEDSLLFLEEVEDAPLPPQHPVGNIRIMVPKVDDFWTLSKKIGAQVIRPIGIVPTGSAISPLLGQMALASALRLTSRILRDRHGRKAPAHA